MAEKSTEKKSTAEKTTAEKTTEESTEKTAEEASAQSDAPGSSAGAPTPDAGSAEPPEPSMRTAAAKARGAAEDITIVMTSRVKEVLQELDMRVDSDLVHTVNQRVQDMLTKAAERAKENQRKTVRPHDL